MSASSLDEGMAMPSLVATPRPAYCAWPQWIERTLRHSGLDGLRSLDEGQAGAAIVSARRNPVACSADASAAPGCIS